MNAKDEFDATGTAYAKASAVFVAATKIFGDAKEYAAMLRFYKTEAEKAAAAHVKAYEKLYKEWEENGEIEGMDGEF